MLDWNAVLTREKLKQVAGSRSYAAGVEYARSGAVTGIVANEQKMTALVQGTERYKVTLEADPDGDLIGDCSCPYGVEGNFCKHCVAVGIAWLEGTGLSAGTAAPTRQTFEEYLEKQDKSTLIALLLEQIHKDADLENHLLLQIAQASPDAPDMEAFRKTIRRAFAVSDYLDYREVYSYVQGIDTVIRSLQSLLENGFALETRQLTEYAIRELKEQLQSIDDSSGSVGQVLAELYELHVHATLQAPPPLSDLVKWLLQIELESDWDLEVGWQDYLPALGEAGRQQFVEEITARWEALPRLGPGDESGYSSSRYHLNRLMIAFAEIKGDSHAVIEIKKRDLSLGYHFLEIAQLYEQAGEPDTALEWAEKGRSAFPDRTDDRLLDFLVEAYTHRKQYGEAYAILWQRFAERTQIAAYQRLHGYAQERGEWEAWRIRCWEHIRKVQMQKPQPKTGMDRWSPHVSDHSEAVRILLWEQRNDEAWQEAQEGGCSRDLWLALAATREVSHPDDALRIYREEAEKQIEAVTGDYSEPFRFLRKVREIMLQTGQEDLFRRYSQRLRAEYKRKRNFIKLLDNNRFPA